MAHILVIDQSTAGSKGFLVDADGRIICQDTLNHRQSYPQPGWVEHDAAEIWHHVCQLLQSLPEKAALDFRQIRGIALTNQRETTIAWDRATGQPLAPAVVWQCQRAGEICQQLQEHADPIHEKTGLPLSPYYPAAKAAWLLQNIPGLRQKAMQGEACIGTVDSYLIYRLTGGRVFATDLSNASRTQLLNLDSGNWDTALAGWFGIPLQALPRVLPSDAIFGETADGLLPVRLPVCGVMGDSHAALFGQGCIRKGMAKATYGTGSSIMLHAGNQRLRPPAGIACSLAWGWQGQSPAVLEGNVTSSGDTLRWLCDDLGLVSRVAEIDTLSRSVPDTSGVYLVPAFSGLGAPYYDSQARAALVGMSRATGKAQVARAALESIAYQNDAVIQAMQVDLDELRVDGGATRSDVLMQFQADLLGCPVHRSSSEALSALGAAYMCGLALGLYPDLDSILTKQDPGQVFCPQMDRSQARLLREGWQQAVNRVR